MSFSQEHLLEINGLKLSGIVNEMSSQQFDEYCKALLAFTESFPAQETELKDLFKTGDYDAFSKVLLGLRDALEQIQATGLAQSSIRLLDELKTQKYLIVEAHLTYVLAEISELSIEILIARQKFKEISEASVAAPSDTEGSSVNQIEACEEDDESKSILAVDDVALTLNSLKLALKGTKYKLTGVKSGTEALKFINSHTPDLFILDIEMPEMNGYELAEKIKISGHTAPIIFLTGNAQQEYVIKAIKAGAAGFIIKPINNEHVLEKIKKCIG